MSACRCDVAYLGAQLATEPTRCERCGGLMDDAAFGRMEAAYAESRRRLEDDVAREGDDIAAAILRGYVPKLPMRFEPSADMSDVLVRKIRHLIAEGYLP